MALEIRILGKACVAFSLAHCFGGFGWNKETRCDPASPGVVTYWCLLCARGLRVRRDGLGGLTAEEETYIRAYLRVELYVRVDK